MDKVILVGGNHHNGLGLVRSFGQHGIFCQGIIIGDDAEYGFLRKSKYWDKVWTVPTENDALTVLLNQKPLDRSIVIPYSDGAAAIIDNNYERLKASYCLPSINSEQGRIAELMNKLTQIRLAESIGLKMLESQIVDLDTPTLNIPVPLIIKPVESIEGRKADITICKTENEIRIALDTFIRNGYHRILVQKYLENKDEYVLTGAVFSGTLTYSIVQHIRQWPLGMGSGSFSKLVVEPKVEQFAKKTLQAISDYGYCGPIDIEFFSDKNGEYYLNEINWRSSGRNFVSLYNGVHSAYYYYCNAVGKPVNEPLINTMEGFSMNEATDLRHVFKNGYSIIAWNRDRRKTKSFALWDKRDLKPVTSRYYELFRALIQKN